MRVLKNMVSRTEDRGDELDRAGLRTLVYSVCPGALLPSAPLCPVFVVWTSSLTPLSKGFSGPWA